MEEILQGFKRVLLLTIRDRFRRDSEWSKLEGQILALTQAFYDRHNGDTALFREFHEIIAAYDQLARYEKEQCIEIGLREGCEIGCGEFRESEEEWMNQKRDGDC